MLIKPFANAASRREAMKLIAALGAASTSFFTFKPAWADDSVCTLTPEISEGPFYFPYDRIREDVREGKRGTPLRLHFSVIDVANCQPIPGAVIDLWQCDASGEYSGYSHAALVAATTGKVGPDGPPHRDPDTKTTYLRGASLTDETGKATFTSIYPGWYDHRAVHVHVKVHVGGNVIHTGQIFFPDSTTDRVFTRQPYSQHTGSRVHNVDDKLFQAFGQFSTFKLDVSGDAIIATAVLGLRQA